MLFQFMQVQKYYSGDEESGFCISGKHLTLKKIQQILSK
jgi:hypothetical protein